MRLTLRTLLAYLDGKLQADDAAALGKKVEESEVAAQLVQKIRDVTHRMRLAAPSLEQRGIALDANSVAEYLDSTLSAERVTELERICIESDVHLAEVASCHQILSLVLGEAAQFEPQSRQRMYGLVNVSAASVPTAATAPEPPPLAGEKPAPAAAAATADASTTDKRQAEVPDYLLDQEAPKRSSRWLAIAALLLAVVGVGLFVTQNQWRPQLEQLLARNGTGSDPVEPGGEATGTATAAAATAGAAATGAGAELDPEFASPLATVPSTGTPPVVLPDTTPPAPASTADATPLVQPPEALPGEMPAATGATPAPGTTPSDSTPPAPAAPPEPREATLEPTTPAEPAPAAEGIGRVVSDRDLLLKLDAVGGWQRTLPRESLMPGQQLLTLPSYRGKIALGNGVSIDLLGGSLVELMPPNAQGVPGVRMLRGRLLAYTVGGPNAQLRLIYGNSEGIATFGDANAMLAIELNHQRAPGTDPVATPGPLVGMLYATGGEIRWTSIEPEAATAVLRAPAELRLSSLAVASNVEPSVTQPEWISPNWDDRSVIDKNASLEVEAHLNAQRPVVLGLRELAKHRLTEVKTLALRCLAQLGEFDDLVVLLRDANEQRSWQIYLDTLAEAIDYDRLLAERLRASLASKLGPKGQLIDRMLWGYSKDGLEAGAAAQLVDYLDHEDLEVRVVSFWTLRRITGLTPASYYPQDTAIKRKPAVQRWRQRLDSGEIVPQGSNT